MAKVPGRSLYRKIRVVIEEARRGKCSSVDDLVDSIIKKAPLDFTYYRVDNQGRVTVVPCTVQSVRRVSSICLDLGLIESESGRLTETGMKAVNSKYFDRVLRQRITGSLAKRGVPVDQINKVIREILETATTEMIPTWDKIRERLSSPPQKKTFRSYLTLLSECEGIGYSRKKIYLPK